MFFRRVDSFLGSENKFVYKADIASVTQFVSLNKVIPARLAEFETSDTAKENIKQLSVAIEKADFSAKVFSHPDCQLYVLHLLEKKKISIDDFLTLNIYLLALMQYTDKQSLRPEDSDIKESHEVGIHPWQELRGHFADSLYDSHYYLHPYNKLDMQQLDAEAGKLNKLNQVVFSIERTRDDNSDATRFMKELSRLSPLMTTNGSYFFIPSGGLMKLMLRCINPGLPLNSAPVCGSIGLATLYRMHREGFHPASIYSTSIASNPKNVHDLRVGPLTTLLHDLVAHVYWGNLLFANHYKFVFEYLIPKASALFAVTVDKLNEQSKTNQKERVLFRVVDLDISNPTVNQEKESADIYLYQCIIDVVSKNKNDAARLFSHLLADSSYIAATYQVDLQKIIGNKTFLNMLSHPLPLTADEFSALIARVDEKMVISP